MKGLDQAGAVAGADHARPPVLRAGPEALAAALDRVTRDDAAVVPLLAPAECQRFIDASADLGFRSAKPVMGEGERTVYQDFDICLSIPRAHRLWDLAKAVERLIAAALCTMATPPLEALPLNDLVLQRYPPGARGHHAAPRPCALCRPGGDRADERERPLRPLHRPQRRRRPRAAGRAGRCDPDASARLRRGQGTGRSTSSTGSRPSATASASATTRRRSLGPAEHPSPGGVAGMPGAIVDDSSRTVVHERTIRSRARPARRARRPASGIRGCVGLSRRPEPGATPGG